MVIRLFAGAGVAIEDIRNEKINTVKLSGLKKNIPNWWTRRKLLQNAKTFHPEVIHAQSLRVAIAASYLSEKLNVPWVISFNSVEVMSEAVKNIISSASAILAVSEVVRAEIVNDLSIKKDSVSVVPNGVNLDEYSKIPNDDVKIPVVGTLGKLTTQKGHAAFLQMAREVLDSGVDAEFLLQGDGPELYNLRRLRRLLGLNKCVTFMSSQSDVKRFFSAINIYVQTSYDEGLGLPCIQAMAAKRPVVAWDVGGLYSVVDSEKTGYLVPSKIGMIDNIAGVVEHVVELINDSTRRNDMGTAGYERAEELFTVSIMAEKTVAIYKSVLKTSN